MYRLKLFMVAAIVIGLVSAAPLHVFAAVSGITNLTADGSSKYEQQVAADGDWVVYEKIDYPENLRMIVAKNTKDGRLKLIQASNDTSEQNINISNNIVTFESNDGTYPRVYMYDLSNDTKKVVSGEFPSFESSNDGITISYIGFKNSQRDLFVYNIASGTTQQLTNDSDQESYSSVSGNLIATVRSGNILIYNLTTREFIKATNSSQGIFWPKLKGSQLVWNTSNKVYTQSLNSSEAIMLYDGSFNDPYFAYPSNTDISDSKVTFTVNEAINNQAVSSVYLYDITTKNKTLVDQSTEAMDAALTDSRLVYVGGAYMPGNRDIYAYDTVPPVSASLLINGQESAQVSYGSNATLEWKSTGATTCTGDSITGLSGKTTINAVTKDKTYTLTCSNSASNVQKTATLHVTAPTLDYIMNATHALNQPSLNAQLNSAYRSQQSGDVATEKLNLRNYENLLTVLSSQGKISSTSANFLLNGTDMLVASLN